MKLFSIAALTAASATGTTTLLQQRSGGMLSPISRVVEVLQNLATKLDKDAKAEEKLYLKFRCWAESVIKEKYRSIDGAHITIDHLDAYIQDIDAGRVEFSSERQEREAEVDRLKKEIAASNAKRSKENKDWQAADEEMQQAINALSHALGVLENAAPPPSMMQKGTKHTRHTSAQDNLILQRLLGPDWEKLNRKATFKMKYKGETLTIRDVIDDMLKTFETNQIDAANAEHDASGLHQTFTGTKGTQLNDAQLALTALVEESGIRGFSRAEASAELTRLLTQSGDDDRFLSETKTTLRTRHGEFQDRQQLRMDEIASVQEAISILRADDERDNFKKSFKSQGFSFAQLAKLNHTDAAKRKAKAMHYLRRALKRSHSQKLAMAMLDVGRVAPDAFDEVISAIDNIVSQLNSEEQTDLDKKEHCELERATNTRIAKDKSVEYDQQQAIVVDKKARVQELLSYIAGAESEIQEIVDARAEALRQRDAENEQWQVDGADDRQAEATVQRAIDALTAYYTRNGLTLLQVAHRKEPGQAPDAPPTLWEGGYQGATAEHDGVVGILTMIKKYITKDITTSHTAEIDAQTAWSTADGAMGTAIGDLNSKIGGWESEEGAALSEMGDAEGTRDLAKIDVDAAIVLLKDLAPGCDYIQVNFGVRRHNRNIERDGLLKAKAALKGLGA